jgi:hypothetical protein
MALSFGLAPGSTLAGACHAWDFCSFFFSGLCFRPLLSGTTHGIFFASLFLSNLVLRPQRCQRFLRFGCGGLCPSLCIFMDEHITCCKPFLSFSHSSCTWSIISWHMRPQPASFHWRSLYVLFFLLTPPGVGDFGRRCNHVCSFVEARAPTKRSPLSKLTIHKARAYALDASPMWFLHSIPSRD